LLKLKSILFMHQLAILIKTYKPDFERAKVLINSINEYNIDKIPVYISVNDEDYDYFQDNLNTQHTLIKDSSIYKTNVTDGWRYQQIIKTQFYRLNVANNYLCIDSDSQFIKNFYLSDFIYSDNIPYTIMHESKSFLETMERIDMDTETIFFKQALQATRKILGTKGKQWDYGPSPYLWSCKVWQHFNEVFLASKNQKFEDFFNDIEKTAIPSETVIYGEYLRVCNLIPILPIEGFFKVYHYKKQFDIEKKFHDIDKLKKVYLGVIFQSNWTQKKKRFKLF
jgi:hypothetical protein